MAEIYATQNAKVRIDKMSNREKHHLNRNFKRDDIIIRKFGGVIWEHRKKLVSRGFRDKWTFDLNELERLTMTSKKKERPVVQHDMKHAFSGISTPASVCCSGGSGSTRKHPRCGVTLGATMASSVIIREPFPSRCPIEPRCQGTRNLNTGLFGWIYGYLGVCCGERGSA